MAGKTNYPEDTEDKIYIINYGEMPFGQLMTEIRAKWPGVEFRDIYIEHEHRHVECLTYDLYDSGDYQDYYVITKKS